MARKRSSSLVERHSPQISLDISVSSVMNVISFTMSNQHSIRAIPSVRRSRKQLRTPNPEVRRRLLEAANELIREDGFPDLRIEQVTQRAGLSVGTFYLYFEGKDDLFTSLVVMHTDRLRAQCQEAYTGPGVVMERLARVLDAYLNFVEENERAFTYFRRSGSRETTAGSLTSWAFSQHALDLQPLLEEGMRTGEIRSDNSTLLTQAVLGLMQHLAGYWAENKDRHTRSEVVGFLASLSVRLLSPRRSAT